MTFVDRFLSSRLILGIVLTLHFVIWFIVFGTIDIHPDMADHWIWSRFLHFGYYEHPPLVAITMKFADLFGENTILGLKTGSVLFSVLILFTGYKVAKSFFDHKTGMVFVLILFATPYFSTGSVFWHIDQPYMFFWLICLLIMSNYLKTGKGYWMLLFGIAAGLGAMAKYIMILLPLSMVVWCIINSEARSILLKWQTYVGALIAIAIVSPNIYWNYLHDWVTFGFVLDKGLKGASFGVHFLHFFVSQFFLFSIVYSVYFWWSLGSKNINSQVLFGEEDSDRQKWHFLLCTGIVPFVFFAITSFAGSRTDPHWVNVAYFSFFLMLARLIVFEISLGHISRQVTFFVSSLVINAALLAFVLVQVHLILLPIHLPDAPPLTHLAGWGKTAQQIETLCRDNQIELPEYVISREYQLSSVLGLYMDHHPKPHSIEKELRNLWSPVAAIKQEGALLVCPTTECPNLLKNAENRFERGFQYLGEIKTIHFGKVLRKLKVFYLYPY